MIAWISSARSRILADMNQKNAIPVIDLFAGPGGLSEGFSQLSEDGAPTFKVHLSIEKEEFAHRTLLLRSFVRQFLPGGPPKAYYKYLRREISRDVLFDTHAKEATAAKHEVLEQPRELGKPTDDRVIKAAVQQSYERFANQHRILIGGPPCQAYSLAGRSRRAREDRVIFEQDEKHYLYREYLDIVQLFKPTVFVMENVKGLLSATVESRQMFRRILDDLARTGYTLYSLSHKVMGAGPIDNPASFIVKAEEYGIPQKRHRLFVVGLINGFQGKPDLLEKADPASVWDAIGDLPRIRSHISKRIPKQGPLEECTFDDNFANWAGIIRDHTNLNWFPKENRQEVLKILKKLGDNIEDSNEFIEAKTWTDYKGPLKQWCQDTELGGIMHHCGRSHMSDDLLRYFFVAAMGVVCKRSPKLGVFPPELFPNHANVTSKAEDVPHVDRFKVQLRDKPSGTVTCHISKDGHYYIHPDPTQCRSLTVREAARIQTFPDNYFFEGPRTEQYRQVGNAVPPLLAYQIAGIIAKMLGRA